MSQYDNGGFFLTGTNYGETKDRSVGKKQAILPKSKSGIHKNLPKTNNNLHKKDNSKLPGIGASQPLRPGLTPARSSINFYKRKLEPENETYMHRVSGYLENKAPDFQKKKKDMRNTESNFSKNMTKEFLENRKKKIQESMDRLYEKDKAKIIDKLNKFEKQNIFKTEIERLEDSLEELKKYHNEIEYKIKALDKTSICQTNIISGFDQKYNVERELKEIEFTEEQVRENQNLLSDGQYTQEKLIHKMEQYQSDIMAYKKNIQQLQARVRQCTILNHDIDYEIDRARQMHDKMSMNFTKGGKTWGGSSGKFGGADKSTAMDTICAQNMEDEMSLFEDRLILNEIKNHEDKLEKEKGAELMRQRILTEEERKTKLEEANRERRKENKRLTKEIEKRYKELSEVMTKMKVTHPEGVLGRVGEMTAIKGGLKDLSENYRNEITKLKGEISKLTHQKNLQTVEEDSPEERKLQLERQVTDLRENKEPSGAKERIDMANRLEELERGYTKSTLALYDHENRYTRSSGILNDSCTTVSRIMYQLQNFQKDKNVEVTSQNVIEYLSHIGLKLERMLAFIYTKNKVIRDEEIEEVDIFEVFEEKNCRITKPPDWLSINPKRVNMDDSLTPVDPRPGDLHEDKSYQDFEAMRKEFKAQLDAVFENPGQRRKH